jgi:paired amphipathic helix protein Sin3a
MLSDIIGRDRSINIFAGFTRDFETVADRLNDASQNTTVLAPLNSAIEKLPRKPWEDPRDYSELGANAYEGEDGYERAQRNLRRFVEAHLIPVSPWNEGEKSRPIGDDRSVWWEMKDGVKVVSNASLQQKLRMLSVLT